MTLDYTPVAPPAPLPWDVDALLAYALLVLGLDPTDVDAPRVELAVVEAVAEIDQALDFDTSPYTTAADIPAPLVGAAANVAVTKYRRKDAPAGVTDAWSVDGAVIRFPSDDLRGVMPTIIRYRSRRGVS